MSPPEGTKKRQRGAELLEFVITLPFILLIAFIFIEFAVALNNQAVLTEASRAAALQAIRGSTQTAAEQAAQNVVRSRIVWYDGATPPEPNISFNPSNFFTLANDPGRPVTVTVTKSFSFHLLPNFLSVFSGLNDLTLTGRTVMLEQKH